MKDFFIHSVTERLPFAVRFSQNLSPFGWVRNLQKPPNSSPTSPHRKQWPSHLFPQDKQSRNSRFQTKRLNEFNGKHELCFMDKQAFGIDVHKCKMFISNRSG
ncbi:hypothetical protein RQM65_01685 [Pricia sp. S334]|uniref:Uncharacterized protein n=1 Tax=Pricia mediterranea TaxID=3076079 RepID=A0ABU3L0W6_9FLAO|nr:hypothetical protein [Pricia sp. S334]MDT7827374.1 hypothetical protein [Pricia sp. S334]